MQFPPDGTRNRVEETGAESVADGTDFTVCCQNPCFGSYRFHPLGIFFAVFSPRFGSQIVFFYFLFLVFSGEEEDLRREKPRDSARAGDRVSRREARGAAEKLRIQRFRAPKMRKLRSASICSSSKAGKDRRSLGREEMRARDSRDGRGQLEDREL